MWLIWVMFVVVDDDGGDDDREGEGQAESREEGRNTLGGQRLLMKI